MLHWYLYVIVFVSGGAVLALEILGTRILGPFYGVSLFLWSALITVTLVALSLGYALGGRIADKGATTLRLNYILAGAGLWTLLTPLLKQPVLFLTEPFGLRFAVLVAAFLLFAPSLTLLGMVSPFAIRIRAQSLSVVGRTAGDLYAISTMGSVVAALLTGFFLIPTMGVNRLTMMIGIALLLLSAVGLLKEKEVVKNRLTAIVLLAMAAGAIYFASVSHAQKENGLVAVRQSSYAELRVVDMGGLRHLIIDGGVHTIVDANTWKSFFPYTHIVDLSQMFFSEPGRLLLIGLGGGTIVKNFSKAGWQVDVVEIDPAVVTLAKAHFGLSPSEGNVYTVDGRQFLMRHNQRYEVIVMDAFGSSSIPFHLVTEESFGLISSRLREQGVFVMNIESRGWYDPLVNSLAATLRQHFQNVVVLPAFSSEEQLGNMIFYASHHKLQLPAPLEWDYSDLDFRSSPQYYKYRAWENRFEPDIHNISILTDDLNPVDLWSEAINLEARRVLHDYFGTEALSW